MQQAADSWLNLFMAKVRVAAFSVSLDGFAAGPRQDINNPLGVRGPEIFQWFFETEVFRKMQGGQGGSRGIDNDMALQSFHNVGAWILGRNMFGPVRGPWPDGRARKSEESGGGKGRSHWRRNGYRPAIFKGRPYR